MNYSSISAHRSFDLISRSIFFQKVELILEKVSKITQEVKSIASFFFQTREVEFFDWDSIEDEIYLNERDLIYGFTENRESYFKKNHPCKIQHWNQYAIDLPNNILLYINGKINLEKIILEVASFDQLANRIEKSILKTDLDLNFKKKIICFHKFCFFLEPHLIPDQHTYLEYLKAKLYNDRGQSLFISKRCKIGLLWAISEKRSVHFILDRKEKLSIESNPITPVFTNFHQCFNKTVSLYTFNELRFIYRLWPHLRDESKESIKFYQSTELDYKEVVAPWVLDPKIAEGYAPKNKGISIYKRLLPLLFNPS